STVCINNLKCSAIGNLGEALSELGLPLRQHLALSKQRTLVKLVSKKKCRGWIGEERLLVNLRLFRNRDLAGLPRWQQPEETTKLPRLLERQRTVETTSNAEKVPS